MTFICVLLNIFIIACILPQHSEHQSCNYDMFSVNITIYPYSVRHTCNPAIRAFPLSSRTMIAIGEASD